MVGGYRIIDLKGINFEQDIPVTVPGIYAQIEDGNSKPYLISNYKISNVERAPFFSSYQVKSTNYQFVRLVDTSYIFTFVVSPDDKVAYKGLSTNNPAGQPASDDEPSASM